MPLEQLCASWKKANALPEAMTQEHISNLEEAENSGIKIIEGRVHIDVMNTLIQVNKKTDKHELIKPVHDIVLGLLDAEKDVRLISSHNSDTVQNFLNEAGADPRILDLTVMDRSDLFKETMFGRNGHYELLIDDKEERPATMHLTHLHPKDIIAQSQIEPS